MTDTQGNRRQDERDQCSQVRGRPARVPDEVDTNRICDMFDVLWATTDRTQRPAPVLALLTEIFPLMDHNRQLREMLIEERRRFANLWAGVRAAVGADDDGEPDPIQYLRDEYAELIDATSEVQDCPHYRANNGGGWGS